MTPIELIVWALAIVVTATFAFGGGLVVTALARAIYEVARYGEVRPGRRDH